MMRIEALERVSLSVSLSASCHVIDSRFLDAQTLMEEKLRRARAEQELRGIRSTVEQRLKHLEATVGGK